MFKLRHSIASFILLTLVFVGCGSTIRSNSDGVTCYLARNIFPVIDSTGKVSVYDTGTVRIYCKGTMRIYALTYKAMSHTDSGSSFTFNRHYAIFDKDSSWGYDIDSSKKIIKQRVKIDSLFQGEWIRRNNFYHVLTENLTKLLTKTMNADSGKTRELYLITDKSNLAELGTIEIWYQHSELAPLDITISKQFDSLKNLKTTKIEVTTYPKFYKENNMTLSSFKMINEFAKTSCDPGDSIPELFNTK